MTSDRSCDRREELAVGDWTTFATTVDAADVEAFAATTGDDNPLHCDDDYAAATRFGGRVVHGALLIGLISAALARFPGTPIVVEQTTRFPAPAGVGTRLTARGEIVEKLGDDRYRVATMVTAGDDETVADGEAVVLLDPVPDGH